MSVRHTKAQSALFRLRRQIRLTWAGLVATSAVRAFWPLWTFVAAAAAAQIAGVAAVAPDAVTRVAGPAVGLAGLILLVIGVRRFHWPDEAEARARLDQTLAGRPIAALTDTQAVGTQDAASRAVWAAHQARMAERLRQARAPWPDLKISALDPFALRYAALTALVLAVIFGTLARLGERPTLAPGGGEAAVPLAAWEGWVEPPAYTGRPSLYLPEIPPGGFEAPVGSRITVRLYGENGALTLAQSVTDAAPVEPAPGTFRFDLARSGRLAVDGAGGAAWDVLATADAPPEVTVTSDVRRNLAGRLSVDFEAADDYGIETGQARITLDLPQVERRHGLTVAPDPRAPVVVDLPMPLRGDRREISETLVEELARHPWASLPVRVELSVTDAAGQEGAAAPLTIELPGRRFLDPMARALIEMRRDILWSRGNAKRAAQVLRAVSHEPGELLPGAAQYLKLRTAIRALEAAPELTTPRQEEVAGVLWALAVEIEDGNLADAKERLRRAQDRLAEAMRQGANDEEIAELMDELRRAMDDYFRQLAQNQQTQDGQEQAEIPPDRSFSEQEFQDLLDHIQDLMEQGRMKEAMELLEGLREMMENLRMAEGQQGRGGQNPGEQAMRELQDTLREQQGLSDEAFRDLQEQGNPSARAGESGENTGRDGGQGRGQSHDGQGQGAEGRQGEGENGEMSLADRQRALEDELARQRSNLPGAGSAEGQAAREALDRAGRAMDEAADALEGGDNAQALDRQAEAIEALREGMRNLGEALAQQQQRGQGTTTGDARDPARRDPLGREDGSGGGNPLRDGPLAEGEDAYRRAEEILRDLRRRSGEGDRPDAEIDYLKRLLEQF